MLEEALLPAPWTISVPAVLLDDNQSPIQRHEGYYVRTDLLLCFNNYRPHFEVRFNLSDQPRGIRIGGLNASRAAQGLEKKLSITFTKSLQLTIRGLILTPEAYETYDLLEKREIDDLPADTKEVVDCHTAQSEDCVPILLDVDYHEKRTLTSNLTLKRPEWAKILGQHGLVDGRLTLVVEATRSTQEKIESLFGVLQDGRDPLFRFRGQRRNGEDNGRGGERYDRKAFMNKPIASPRVQELIGYQATDKFSNLREYSTLFSAGAILDRMEELRRVRDYEADLKTLVLVECIDDGPSGGFYGFIDAPSNKSFRLRVGDCLDIEFEKNKGHTWRAVVTSPLPVWRARMVPLLVYPARKKKLEDWKCVKDHFEPEYIDPEGMTTHELRHAVAADKGNSVEVEVIGVGDVLDNICRAYDSLADFQKVQSSESTAFTERMIEVLTSRRLDQLPCKDLYEHIKNHLLGGDIKQYMKELNPEQLVAVESSRCLQAGIQIIQGPPGTGKTFLMQQMIVPFLVSRQNTLVLVSTPTNHGADDLAHELRHALDDLKNKPELSHLRKRYILRLHAEASENSIMRTQGPKRQKEEDQNPKGPLPSKSKRVATGAAAQMLEQFRANDGCKFEGVRDKRIQDIVYSVGYMMLLVSGVIPDSEYEERSQEHDPYARFRQLYAKRYTRGEFLDQSCDEEEKFQELADDLYKAVLQGASVIVSTTAGISSSHCLPFIKHKVAAVFLDENAHEREDALAPLFAGHFKLDPCIVLIGDQEQLAPNTQADGRSNAFTPQLRISWMARLIRNGMEYTMLTEQHRMVEDVAHLCNTLTYQGKLTNAPSTALDQRANATAFRTWMESLAKDIPSVIDVTPGTPSNRDMIDVQPGGLNMTKTKKGSKYNDYFGCLVANIVTSLLKEFGHNARIAVLTAYSEQRGNYLRMLGNMKEAKLENVDKLTVDTVDGAQGRQFDFVIVDLPVNHGVGFLEDSRRLNVALSRARDGLIVVCDKATIRGARGVTGYLRQLLELFERRVKTVTGGNSYPPSPYYTLGDHDDDSD